MASAGLHQLLCLALYKHLIKKGFKKYNFSDVRNHTLDLSISLQAGVRGVDAVAIKDKVKYYFEVETHATLRAVGTRGQLISMAVQEGKKFLVVPPHAYEEALNVLRLTETLNDIKVLCLIVPDEPIPNKTH